jgi:hypothetical protein
MLPCRTPASVWPAVSVSCCCFSRTACASTSLQIWWLNFSYADLTMAMMTSLWLCWSPERTYWTRCWWDWLPTDVFLECTSSCFACRPKQID